MNCDDIYLPAIEGDIELLRTRLEAGEVDLNELIDCGVANGKRTEIPLLFSILTDMIQKESVNYEVLELLYEYGIDFDGEVILSDESSKMRIPILVYFLTQWSNTELFKFLLDHGAYTNACRTTVYATGAKERLNLLYFAISNCEGTEEMELLLLNGADPDACNLIYAQEEATQQKLPALYYTTAVNSDAAKTSVLLQFGASLKTRVDTGIGWRHDFAIDDYLCEVYPYANQLLWRCYNNVQYGCRKAVRKPSVPGPRQKLKKDEAAKPTADISNSQTEKTPASKPEEKTASEDDMGKIRRLGKQLIDFDYAKSREFMRYDSSRKPDHTSVAFPIIGLIAAAFVLLNWFVFKAFEISWVILMVAMFGIYIFLLMRRKNKADERGDKADALLAQRKQMVQELNRLAQGKDITPWWNGISGFNIASNELHQLLVWTPFDRVYDNTSNNGLALKGLCMESDPISGASVAKMLKSKDYRVIINSGIKPESNYKISELCLWTLLDGTYVYKEGATEEEIKRDMAEYNARQDEKERFRNFLDHKCIDMTDEDRFWYTDMTYAELEESRFWRQMRADRYEEKLRNARYTVMEDKDKYNHFLEPVGVVIFDASDNIVGILVYRKNFQKERYETDSNKMIFRTVIKDTKFDLAKLDMTVIRSMRNYPVAAPDLASLKKEGFTDTEWSELIYACSYNGNINKEVSITYAEVAEKKRNTIAANTSLLR